MESYRKDKIIKFECPTINLQDVNICCGQSTTIGVPLGNDQTYSWSSIPANINSTSNSIIVEPITPTVYNLVLTDYVFPFPSKKGCVANGSAVVFPLPPNFLTIEKKFNKCSLVPTYNSKVNLDYTGTICTPATSAFNLARPNYISNLTSTLQNTVKWYFRYFTDPDNCPNGNSLQASDWMFLGTQSTMNPPYGRGEIKAVYEDPCKSPITQTWTGNVFLGTNLDYLKEDFALISPGRMEPTHPTIPERRIMRISEFHPCAPENVGDAPAYGNISDFQLLIFNRWGTNFRTITKADIDKGPNDAVLQGDIFWDGRIVKNGPLVQKGVYVYQLRVQMCPGGNWVDVTSKIYTAQRKNCVVILPFFPALCFGWLNLSSDAVYDAQKIPLDEDSTREPTDLYALSHIAREMMLEKEFFK
ncbi:MAG: hypothetical protein EBS86_10400, partial [Crocinitomicaceae bacterium]|nr:hypothetical protein [Crocinitomicaceae bacterium]